MALAVVKKNAYRANGAAAKPQRLLVTLLGDYWKGRTDHIPSAALVRLLAEFGVGPLGARSALSRLASRGLLARSQRGRCTFYGLTERALGTFEEGARRIFAFGAEEKHWDGKWSVVAFSVAEADRDRRHVLRTRLRWLGFAPLYPGVWVSPDASLDRVSRALDQVGIASATLLRGDVLPRGARSGEPLEAWDLSGIRRHYDAFLHRFGPYRARLRTRSVVPAEALVDRTRLMDEWRRFPREDPDLPAEFLPRDWPRKQARALFLEVYDALGPMAERHVREIVRDCEPEDRHE